MTKSLSALNQSAPECIMLLDAADLFTRAHYSDYKPCLEVNKFPSACLYTCHENLFDEVRETFF